MADVNDAGNIEGKHKRRLEQVENADIDDRDREAILAFHDYRRAVEGVKPNTLTNDLSTLRCAAERSALALVDMSETDVQDFLVILTKPTDEEGYGLDPDGSGMFNYCRALRIFYRWLDGRGDHDDYPFHENIDLPKQTTPPVDPDGLLAVEEVRELKRGAARGRMGARDKALIAFLADGPRVTLASQLRVGDVNVRGTDMPSWKPNPNGGGHKGVGESGDRARTRPFLWSSHEVTRWLSHHPDADNPEAPLWTISRYDPENPSEGALSPDGIRAMLDRVAERVGIDKDVNPHSFRHAAWTRCRLEGVDPEHLRVIAGWSDLRQLERYDHVTDDERNASVRETLGLPTRSDDDEENRPVVVACVGCGHELDSDTRYCPDCGEVNDLALRLARNQAVSDVGEGLRAEAGDADKTLARADVQQALREDTNLRNAILDDLADMLAERGT